MFPPMNRREMLRLAGAGLALAPMAPLQALAQTDLPVISGFLMVAALFFVAINLVVDLLYAIADPRLRIQSLNART